MRYDRFHRKLKAREPEAVLMEAAMKAACVSIPTFRKPPERLSAGETYATGAIRSVLRSGGPVLVGIVLKVLASRGDPSIIRADTIRAMSIVLSLVPEWAEKEADLVDACRMIDIAKSIDLCRRLYPGPGLHRVIATRLVHDIAHQLRERSAARADSSSQC